MYRIHILTNDEFDSLGSDATRGSDVSHSLGFANKFTGDAYVRSTACGELNRYLISHELDELINHDSAHEDINGIRHKDAFDVLQWIPVVNMVAAPIGLASGKGAHMGLLGTFGGDKGSSDVKSEPEKYGQYQGFNGMGENPEAKISSDVTGAGSNPVGGLNQGLGAFDQYNAKRNYLGGF